MTKTHNVASFVLRFTQEMWQDPHGEPHVRWRGHIRHVQGNEEERFTDFAEAVTFIQRYLTELTEDSLAGDENVSQEKVFNESFKFWEQFAASYSNMMLQAMEQTARQSETIKEQMDEATKQAFTVWQLPGQFNQKEIMEALNNIQAQMQALSNRLEKLEETIKK
jgi:murein L,D-transpeptidase YafK